MGVFCWRICGGVVLSLTSTPPPQVIQHTAARQSSYATQAPRGRTYALPIAKNQRDVYAWIGSRGKRGGEKQYSYDPDRLQGPEGLSNETTSDICGNGEELCELRCYVRLETVEGGSARLSRGIAYCSRDRVLLQRVRAATHGPPTQREQAVGSLADALGQSRVASFARDLCPTQCKLHVQHHGRL